MMVICSYCKRVMGHKPPLDDPNTTHSICPACFAHYAPQWEGLTTGEFLDRFDAPVVVVDLDVRVVAINRALADACGIECREAIGLLGGELLECNHALEPGGCGRTIHCRGCAIRELVGRALESGEPQFDVPASLELDVERKDLSLSSYTHDGLVYLLIEPAVAS